VKCEGIQEVFLLRLAVVTDSRDLQELLLGSEHTNEPNHLDLS
jgi:hypothetical protein